MTARKMKYIAECPPGSRLCTYDGHVLLVSLGVPVQIVTDDGLKVFLSPEPMAIPRKPDSAID